MISGSIVTLGQMERVHFIFLWLAVLFVPTQDIYSNPGPGEHVIRSNNFSRFEENGKVGLKDEEGHILIPAIYDAIGWSNGKFSILDKVVGYQTNGLWGLIHTSNKVVVAAEFMDLKPGDGSFLVVQKRSALSQRPSSGIIHTSGKIIIPCLYDGLQISNMRAVVMSRSGSRYLFGLLDFSNKIIIPLEYQQIYSLGSLRYAVENFENKTAIFSDEGTQVTGFTIDSISTFKKDYAVVYQHQRQGLIDRNGHMVLKPTYGDVKINDDGTVQVREMDSWFFLDGENKTVREYRSDGIRPLSPHHYLLTSGGKVQLTNNDFQSLHDGFLSSLGDFRNGKALFRSAGKTGVINTDGKIVLPAHYQDIRLDQNVFIACLNTGYKNRWVILNSEGNPITERQYEYIAPFNGRFYPVRNRGYWGAVNPTGEEIITCVHDSLVQQKGNNIVVKFKGEYGVINLHENWVVTPQANPLELLNEEAYFEFADSTTFVKSLTGNIIYFSDNRLEYHGGIIREHLPTGASWIIDMNGIVVDRSAQPERTERIFPESEGLRAILKDGKYGFIDAMGRLRIANRYEAAQPFNDGMAAIRIRNKWGFIDRQERLVVQPVYDRVENFKNGYAIVSQHNLSGLIDETGRIVLPVRYDQIIVNEQNRFKLRQGTLQGLADAYGNIIIHPKYDDVIDAGNGFVIVQRNGKCGVLTLRGVSTIPMVYDELIFDPHHNQFMALKKSPWKPVTASRPAIHKPQK